MYTSSNLASFLPRKGHPVIQSFAATNHNMLCRNHSMSWHVLMFHALFNGAQIFSLGHRALPGCLCLWHRVQNRRGCQSGCQSGGRRSHCTRDGVGTRMSWVFWSHEEPLKMVQIGKVDAKSKASKFGNDIVNYAWINWTYWMQKKLVVSVSKYLADFQRRVFGSRNCAIFLTDPAWLHIKRETMWDRETLQKDQQNGSAAT